MRGAWAAVLLGAGALAACGNKTEPIFASVDYTPIVGSYDLVSIDGQAPETVILGRDTAAGSSNFGRDFVVGRVLLKLSDTQFGTYYEARTCTGWVYPEGLTALALTHADGNAVRMTSRRDFTLEGTGTVLFGVGRGSPRTFDGNVDMLLISSRDEARFGQHEWVFVRSETGRSCTSAAAGAGAGRLSTTRRP
jgi:hypothetical protein